MARMERYSDEEVAKLEKLVGENATKGTPLSVAELAVVAEGKLAGRTADALKQRIFKMQREHTAASRPTKKVARNKIPKPKAEVRAAAPKGKFIKDPPRTRTPRRNGILRSIPTPELATFAKSMSDSVTLILPDGRSISGHPARVAEFVRSL